MKLRLLIVDDHRIFREALRGMLEANPDLEVVGEAGDSAQALRLVDELAPDIVCMDIGMSNINGIETTRRMTAVHPEVRVIALSTYADRVYVNDMMNAGAVGYVAKSARGKELLDAISAVARGQHYVCPTISRAITWSEPLTRQRNAHGMLGPREREVLRLVAQGLSSPQIGARLDIATGTVDVHRRNIMRKLDLHNAAELTRYALTTGLIAD